MNNPTEPPVPPSPSGPQRLTEVTIAASAVIDQLTADVAWYKSALEEKSQACKSYQYLLDDMEMRRDRWRVTAITAIVCLLAYGATSLAFR